MIKAEYLTISNTTHKIHSWEKALHAKKKTLALHLPSSALLVIDMQNYFLKSDSHAFVPSSTAVLANTNKLIDHFRKEERPIIFTYFAVENGEDDPIGRWWNDTVLEGSAEAQLHEALKRKDDDLVLRKSTYSAFHMTSLERALKDRYISQVVLTGVITNLCLETTAREAFVRNFDVFFVMDATAAYNEQMHVASLANLSYCCATPIATSEVL